MKKLGTGLLAIAAIFTLVACGSKQTETKQTSEKGKPTKIVVGSQGGDAEIWKFIAKSDLAKQADVQIEVKEIDGGPQLNSATADGTVTVNAFQSLGYLVSFNKESKEKLIPIATTYMEPMGIYSSKYKKVSELPEKAVIALADNPANTARGLRLLEAAGLITLKSDFNNGTGTPADIKDNPQKLTFKLIDDTTGPRILPDVDAALISNTVAFEGGLNVLKDSLYKEKIDPNTKTSINVLVTTQAHKNDQALKKLADLYHSDEVKQFIADKFGGTKVEVKEPIDALWKDVQ